MGAGRRPQNPAEQAQRCRDILAKITQLSSSGAPFDRMRCDPDRGGGGAAPAISASRSNPNRGRRASEPVDAQPRFSTARQHPGERVDFARATVEVNAWWMPRRAKIVISDDGPRHRAGCAEADRRALICRARAAPTTPERTRRAQTRRVHRANRSGTHWRESVVHQPDIPIMARWSRSCAGDRFETGKHPKNHRLRPAPEGRGQL